MDEPDDAERQSPSPPGSSGDRGPLTKLPSDFPVVGIGSSAGGLDALTKLLGELPAEPDLAIVVVSHGDPDEESRLVDLLARATDVEVVEVEEGMEIRRDRVHVAPPGTIPEIHDDRLQPLAVEEEGVSHAIDRFLRSLSDVYRAHAVGVILSGSLSDGAQGLQAIQQRGGIAIVQDPDTAQYASMPHRAIEAGHVDHVLSPEMIAAELGRVRDGWAAADDEEAISDDVLKAIFERVRELTGVDFSRYKRTTLVRRIHRRMIATRTQNLETYLTELREDAEEVWRLHDESLIHVTEFFRDPEVFEALSQDVLPDLVDEEGEGPIRVWVPGCATGEEVYSIAILLAEHLSQLGIERQMQLFGTDLSERAIETAREARYPLSIAEQVSEERLQRFFVQENGSYRVRESLRNVCVFARHDLLNDPPFSEIDLVSCRNVFIYLHHEHQEDVANTLHYALEDDGALLLGSSESIQRFHNLFEPLDPEHNLYSPKQPLDRAHPATRSGFNGGVHPPVRDPDDRPEPGETDLGREIDRVALDLYAPPALVLDGELEVVEFRGDVSAYLDPQEGQASLGLMSIAPRGLALAIRSAVDEIHGEGGPVRKTGVGFQRAGERRTVSLRIVPVLPTGQSTRFYLVAFEDERTGEADGGQLLNRVGGVIGDLFEPAPSEDHERVTELEEELDATRAYLQSVIEDYEATNEELRSAHEEALSTNEELQSTNEELETTKEELQSTNEELTRVNEEFRERNRQIEQVNTDLVNLLEGVGLPIVMLDDDLRIRRFTPQAADVLGLIEADEGRPLDDFNLPFNDVDLEQAIREVLHSLSVHRTVLEAEDGTPHRLRITPYETGDGAVEGAVLVFWDLDADGKDA